MTAEQSVSRSLPAITRQPGFLQLPHAGNLEVPLQDKNNDVKENSEEKNSGITSTITKSGDSGYLSQRNSWLYEEHNLQSPPNIPEGDDSPQIKDEEHIRSTVQLIPEINMHCIPEIPEEDDSPQIENKEHIQSTIQSIPDISEGDVSPQRMKRPTCTNIPSEAKQECNNINSASITSDSPDKFFPAPTSDDLKNVSQEQPPLNFCSTQCENVKAPLTIHNKDTKNINREISSTNLVTEEGNNFSKGRKPKIRSQTNSQNWKSPDICPACGKANYSSTMPPSPFRKSKSDSSLSEKTLRLPMKQCEEEKDDIREKIIRNTIRQNFPVFRDSTDFVVLIAHLTAEGLLHPAESEILNNLFYTQVYKANHFYLEILNRKGPKAYKHFYSALKAEKTHKGHPYLLEILDQALANE